MTALASWDGVIEHFEATVLAYQSQVLVQPQCLDWELEFRNEVLHMEIVSPDVDERLRFIINESAKLLYIRQLAWHV